MLAHYQIDYEPMGEGEVPPESLPQAFFCLSCGRVWAQVFVPGKLPWVLNQVPCQDHSPTGVPDYATHPGSILGSSDLLRVQDSPRLLAHLPRPVLVWELSLLLKEYDHANLGLC